MSEQTTEALFTAMAMIEGARALADELGANGAAISELLRAAHGKLTDVSEQLPGKLAA